MSRMLEIPENIYAQLLCAAEARGLTPAGWIQEHLPRNDRTGEDREVSNVALAAADAALDACVVSLGRALGTDNDQIDADLAREYGDDHKDFYVPSDSQ